MSYQGVLGFVFADLLKIQCHKNAQLTVSLKTKQLHS